jgi:hypothetical protein
MYWVSVYGRVISIEIDAMLPCYCAFLASATAIAEISGFMK